MSGFIRLDFAGAGGMDEGLRLLGLHENAVGVEYAGPKDPGVAARVAQAAGHKRWVVDVTSTECRDYAWPPIWLYIATPPCQTFSMAGKGDGRAHMAALLRALYLVAAGATPEGAIAQVHDAKLDVRSVLSLEPMRVIRAHLPTTVVFEEVKEVQPLWNTYADILRAWGYSVWTGPLQAEQYGVPQTRRRAILIASREREVGEPRPTHSRYYSRDPQRLDDGVLPWVSMAQALEWGMTARPYPTVAVGTKAGGVDSMALGGTQARSIVYGEREAGRWVEQPEDHPRARDWRQHPEGLSRFNDQTGTAYDADWPEKRPATTVAGREIVQNPGATANRFNGATKSRNDGVRVTVEEAGVLQSFRPDYPWAAAGTKTAQFQRVGDAVPPLLARAVLAEAVGLPFFRAPEAGA